MEKQKKKFVMPDTYVIVFGLIILTIILTWIIPAGKFDMDGKKVLAGTFHLTEKNPAGIGQLLSSVYDGMTKGASTIFLVLIIGAAFQIVIDTGTISATISTVIRKTNGNYKVIVPVMMIVMGILGALGCGINVALAFTGIMVILAKKLNMDKVAVVAMLYFAANTGFSGSPINPFTVLLGQQISEIQTMSGALPRLFMDILFMAVAIIYTMRYIAKGQKDPSKQLAPFTAEDDKEFGDQDADNLQKLNLRQTLCLIVLVGTFVVFAWGTVEKNWDLPALGSCMVAMALLCGIIGGLTPNQMAKSFVNGAKTQVTSAMLVGLASAINVIMTNAGIIHSVIYYLTLPIQSLPTWLSAVGMFFVNFIFNICIPSGSGQCYVVMPIMAPMADVLGMTRQVAISAFQFGDGLCNAMMPTTSMLMGMLGIAHIPFTKWEKFVIPATALLSLCAIAFLIVTTVIGWA